MAKTRRKSRFLKETSQRSGFDNWDFDGETFHKRWEGIRQNNLTIAPEEFDNPPPSTKPLGGADINRAGQRPGYLSTDTPTATQEVTHYVNGAAITIPANWSSGLRFLIVGSNLATTVTANPQIIAGLSNQTIALMCVGSSVTFVNSNGLILRRRYTMNSGDILCLVYNSTTAVWYETSRGTEGASQGAL